MPVPIKDINSLTVSTIVQLFELDMSPLGVINNPIRRFCNYTNGTGSVYWKGFEYPAFPIKAEGYEYNGKGALPRPTITVSNLLGVISSLVLSNDDLLGAKFTRKRTLAKYIDGSATANTGMEFLDDVYFIERKVNENALFVEFELASTLDLEGFMLPRRVMTAATCGWQYKSAQCGYTGGLPACDKSLNGVNGCKAHFGEFAELPFGGFPGLDNQGGY